MVLLVIRAECQLARVSPFVPYLGDLIRAELYTIGNPLLWQIMILGPSAI